MRARSFGALAVFALLAACGQGEGVSTADKPAVEAATSANWFAYDFEEDVSGDYAPLSQVSVQNWTLDHIFIGGSHVFDAWLAGERNPERSPLMIIFKDGDGNDIALAAGQFKLGDGDVKFEAGSPITDRVSFEGRIDLDALATARRTLGSEIAVLEGSLRIGSQNHPNVRFKTKTGG